MDDEEEAILVLRYQTAVAEVAKAQATLDMCKRHLLNYMEARSRKTIKVTADGYLLQCTYTQQTTVKVDEKGLKKALGAPVFNKFTKRVLDRRALEAALDKGSVSPVKVTPFITATKSDPFIRFTMKEDKHEV